MILALLFKGLCDLAYFHFVSPRFGYSGLTLAPDEGKILLGYLATAALSLALPARQTRPSHLFGMLLMYTVFIPSMTSFGMEGHDTTFAMMIGVSVAIVLLIPRFIPRFAMPLAPLSSQSIDLFLWSAVGFVAAVFIFGGGLSFVNFDIMNVYETRHVVNEKFFTGPLGYLTNWGLRIGLPSLIALYLLRKNKIMVAILLALNVFFFSISSSKAQLFLPFLIVILAVIGDRKSGTQMLALALCVFVGASMLETLFWNTTTLNDIAVRRGLFVPADLNYAFHDVFTRLGHVRLSNSVLGFMFEYPFDIKPIKLVAREYFGHTDISPNNGFIATSYMHFGYGGMVAFAVIVGVLLWTVDSLSLLGRLPNWFAVGVLLLPMLSLFNSSDLPTALLTHGAGPAILLLWLIASASLMRLHAAGMVK